MGKRGARGDREVGGECAWRNGERGESEREGRGREGSNGGSEE